MRIYVSGQIKGLDPDIAKANFHEASRCLERQGFDVCNPLEIPETFEPASREDWHACMVIDIEHLFKCDAIFMLHNWRISRGARAEHAIADVLDMPIFYAASELPIASNWPEPKN